VYFSYSCFLEAVDLREPSKLPATLDEIEERFSAFFQANFRLAVRFVSINAVGHPDPESISADAFELFWAKAIQMNELPNRSWLFKVLRNKLGDYYRSQRRHQTVPLNQALQQSTQGESVDTLLDVRQCLENLAEQHREVLVLAYWCDLSGEEASKALEIGAMAFRTRLKRAKRAFAKLYSNGDTSVVEGVDRWIA
jgi:RNA polymerase sigma-70 factor (ECF subfamily)